jgi:hypothetical protein
MHYSFSTNPNTHNKVIKAALVTSNRKEVTDLKLGTNKVGNLVTNWCVSYEICLSYHIYTVFQVCDLKFTRFTYCNPKGTNR